MSLKSIGIVSTILKDIAISGNVTKASFDALNLSLQGMTESQIAAALSLSGLSAEQVASSLASSGFTAAETAAALATMHFSEEATVAALTTAGFEKAQIEGAVAATTFTVAETAATTATGGLSTAIAGLGAVIAANPIGAIITAITVVIALIPIAINLFNKFHKSTEELKQEYDDLASELDGLNSELKTTKDRIAELQKLSDEGKITLIEQEELSKLLETNAQLERQIRLREEAAKKAGEEANKSLVKDYDKQSYSSISGTSKMLDASALYEQHEDDIKLYQEMANGWLENWDKLAENEKNRIIELYNEYDRLLREGNNEQMYPFPKDTDEYIQELIDRYKELDSFGNNITDAQKGQMEEIRSELVDLGDMLQTDFIDNFVGDGETLDNWNALADAIDACINPAEHFTSLLNSLPTDLKDALSSEGANGELTAERVNELAAQYQELADWMGKSGYTADEVASHYNALKVETDSSADSIGHYSAQLSDLTEVLSDLQSAYDVLATAQEEMAGGGGLSADTIADLAEAEANYLDYLYEENGIIKLNTEAWKENANAKMLSDIDEIQKEINSLEERNDVLEKSLEMYRTNKSMSMGDTASLEAWDKKIKETSDEINVNTNAISENQAKLALYSSLYGNITGDMDVYTSALSNFTNIANTIDSVSGSLQTLADLQAQVANGFTMSLDKALEFAAVYPEILNNAQVAANGQITLNKDVVNSFIQGKEAELNAEVDAKITELEVKKSVLEAQLAFSQAELDLAKEVGEGESQIAKEVAEFRLDTANKLVAALIEAGVDEATAFQLACAAMAGNAEEFDRIAMEVCTDVNGNFNKAAYEAAQAIYKNMNSAKRDVASLATQAQQTAEAIAGMADGVKKGSAAIVGGSGGGTLNSGIKLNLTGADFKGTEYTYEAKEIGLEDFISDLELDISKYQNAIAQIDGQIAALQALKNTPLKSFKSGSGSGGTDSSTKEIEKYTASIDDYREAIERLNRIQIKRTDLETKLSNTNDLRTQIELQKELIGVYKEEQNALHDLNELRDQTIKEGVESLQELGFNVEYDPDSNLFFVKNLEHLNELVADSAGEYGSLQEATNALRKDTETLINTLGNLNEANQENSKSWSELAQAAHEARIAIYENTRKESENQIKISENLLSHSLSHAQKVGMNFSVSVNDSELQELINVYKEEIATVESLGIDLNKTIYGNIDTNNRQILEWTEDNLNKYKDALASWDTTVDEMRGSFSTIFGSSSEYDGIEIAFSPILQTENGPVLLDSHTLDEYIYGLIDKAGEGWTSEKLLQLDTEGLEFDGQIIKNLLADIGDTAIQTGEAMHYVGDLGSISITYKELEEAAVSAQMSVEDLNNAIANGSVQNIETSDIGYFYDISSIELHISDIISQYRKMQDTLLAEAEEYRRQGYADTSNEISELIDLWWDYYDKIAEVSAEAWGQVVDNANEALNRITGIFDTLKGAAKEFAESGYITVDTLQEICSWGIQYLAYLQDENGQLVINEGNIQNVIAARTEQMAVETALSYVAQIRSAIERNEINELMNLTLATEATTNATWDLVYAQLRLMNLSGELNDTMYAGALQNVNNLRSLTANVVENVGQMYTCTEEIEEDTSAITDALREQKELLEDQADAMDDLLKYVKEMIKQEVKNQIKALEDQVSEYKKIVNLQKESLKLEREKDNYNKNVKNKINDIADLQKRIAMLDLDGSREAQAEKVKLQEELAELQEDLADTQADHAYDATCNMLDDMADAYEEEKKKEIEILENSISSEEKLYQLAIERIQTQWDTLYQQLIDWNYEYGTVTNDEITSVWQSASAAVEKYGSYLDAVLATTREIAALEAQIEAYQSSRSSSHSSSGGGMSTSIPSTPSNPQTNNVVGNSGKYDTSGDTTISQVKSIVHQMKTNSEAHHSADTEGKARLNKTNLELGKQFTSITGRTAVRGDDGVWYLDRVGGPRLYETYPYSTYHTGGIVGDDPTLKQNEVFAKLKKGEAVLTEEQQKPIYKVLDFAETMINQFGGLFAKINATDMMNMRIQDNFNKDAQQIQNIVQTSSGNTFDINVPVEVHTVQKLDETEIRKLTKDISKYTITEINDSLAKKGLNSVKNPLRP